MADTIQILKCGLRFDSPALLLSYKDWKTGKTRQRSMPLRNFNKHSGVDKFVEDLAANPRHSRFIRLIAPPQLQRLLTILKDKLSGLSIEASVARNNQMDTIDPNENLNKADDETLKRKKLQMDTSFEKNRKKPGDPDFQYNVEVDFEANAIETSGWDSEDDSDVDF